MKKLVSMALMVSFLALCDSPAEVEECTPVESIELISPLSGSFEVGETVNVSWKVNREMISQVDISVSANGENGPWRRIFGRGINVPGTTGETVCMDTAWTIGEENENIDYSTAQTVLLKICNYSACSGEYDISSPLAVNP